MDAHNLDKLKGQFDVVFCFGVYYHLVDPILGFDRICDKVKPGGLLLLEGDSIHHPNSVMFLDFNKEDKSRTFRMSQLFIYRMLEQRNFVAIKECWSYVISLHEFETFIPDYNQKFEAYRTMLRCWK